VKQVNCPAWRLVHRTGPGNENDDEIRIELGKIQVTHGDYPAAEATYTQLKARQPENALVWNNLVWIYQELGDIRALEHGERAQALAPHQPQILDTVGWILLKQGAVQRALELLQEAFQKVPHNPDIAYHYAAALHKSGHDNAARFVLEAVVNSNASFATRGDAGRLLASLSEK
jgi:Flp pilus assembly protein TadD